MNETGLYEIGDILVGLVAIQDTLKAGDTSGQVENLPENISLRIYPEKIKLLCKAPISELKRINENAFKVVCNYNEISEETTYLIPQLIEQPKFLSSVKILDRKVEFLIKKQ